MTGTPALNLVETPAAEPLRRPWLKFFPSDCLGDERLRMCSAELARLVGAQGPGELRRLRAAVRERDRAAKHLAHLIELYETSGETSSPESADAVEPDRPEPLA